MDVTVHSIVSDRGLECSHGLSKKLGTKQSSVRSAEIVNVNCRCSFWFCVGSNRAVEARIISSLVRWLCTVYHEGLGLHDDS